MISIRTLLYERLKNDSLMSISFCAGIGIFSILRNPEDRREILTYRRQCCEEDRGLKINGEPPDKKADITDTYQPVTPKA